jgi:large subunit ribosomal protein L21
MYAVIKAGGKQHRVKPGDVIEVELMHAKDDAVEFHPLLVVDDENKTHVGKGIAKAVVTAKLVGEQKGEKVKVFKYRNKTGYTRHQGHRQRYTLIEIGEIKLPGQPAAKASGSSKDDQPSEAEAKPAAKASSSKSAAAKAAAAAEPASAEEEETTAADDATEAADDATPAEVTEVAAAAETGPDAAAEGETEAQAEAEAAE